MTRREWIGASLAAPVAGASVSVKDIETALKLSVAGDASRTLAAKITALRKSPLIDGRRVAFVLEHAKPAALVGAAARFKRIPLRRLPGTAVQVHVMEIEKDQKVPYGFEVDGAPVADPWNPTGVVTMPDYRPPREALGEFRGDVVKAGDITLYTPKGGASALMVVLDGAMYVEAGLPQMLVSVKSLPAIGLAVAPADADPRQVLSELQKRTQFQGNAASRCVMGAGQSGWRAFQASWQSPEVFGRVLAQSAAFPERGFPDEVRNSAAKPIRGFLSAGRNDPESVIDANHLVWGALRQKGYAITCQEDEGFACIFSWQRLLPAALAHTWGG